MSKASICLSNTLREPALFLTLTPNTDNSLVMAHYAGITDVSSAFDLLDTTLSSKAELRQASFGNDCMSTRLFMRAVDAFIRHALGIDADSKKKDDRRRPFW
jgi:hypothetical protein